MSNACEPAAVRPPPAGPLRPLAQPSAPARPNRASGCRLAAWRRRAALAALAAGCAALATGCAGLGRAEASRLHALGPVAQPAAKVPCTLRFAVRELRLAGHLDRPEVIVARQGSRVMADGADLWAAPLDAELRRVLSRALAARLDGSQPVPHPWRLDEAPRLAVGLDVDRLEPEAGVLVASVGWRLVDVAAGRQLAWGHWQARQPLGDAAGMTTGQADAAADGTDGPDDAPAAAAGAAAAATVGAIDAAWSALADTLAARIAADPAAGAWCRTAP